MENTEEIMNSLIQELRRGSLVLMVLSQLSDKQYGYSLVQRLEAQGLDLDPGTLYPLLRRLEKQNLLDSQWEVEGGRPRRYYMLSAGGRLILARMADEWRNLNDLMNHLLNRAPDQD